VVKLNIRNILKNKVMKANELSAKDLMEGDWVYGIFSGCPQERITMKYSICSNSYEWKYMPIPLTAEILEKNGFKEYDGLYRLDITEGVFINVDFKSKEPFVSVHNTCYRAIPICWYLHQLQHALKLCGIEKEIEL
jgi:hypothetical protein